MNGNRYSNSLSGSNLFRLAFHHHACSLFRACRSPSNRCRLRSALRLWSVETPLAADEPHVASLTTTPARLRLDIALLSTSSEYSPIRSLIFTTSYQSSDCHTPASLPTQANCCPSFVSGYGSLGGCGRWRYAIAIRF
jgi:hypothetical protein